jgi:hypothetical protein
MKEPVGFANLKKKKRTSRSIGKWKYMKRFFFGFARIRQVEYKNGRE